MFSIEQNSMSNYTIDDVNQMDNVCFLRNNSFFDKKTFHVANLETLFKNREINKRPPPHHRQFEFRDFDSLKITLVSKI